VAASPANLEVIPSAGRLVRSLRDMGYDFVQAVADLVDNSLAAGASEVCIDVTFSGSASWVRIADNGHGMSKRDLIEAMRFGSQREYDKEDLGRFGLGLKTASLSQCRRLTVASRTDPARRRVIAFAWDIDHLERTNRWEVLPVEGSQLDDTLQEPLGKSTGTVVVWKRIDRILDYAHPNGESARKKMSTMCRDLEAHLAMVFHRFLAAPGSRRKFRILLNGNPVEPWDPFVRGETKTRSLDPVRIPVEGETARGEVLLERFVLPHQSEFSSPEAFRRASGPANWNQQQGIYIYRANRLIQAGGWCGLRTVDEHLKLARVALSFSPALDAAFRVNVAKMRVQLPASARDAIREQLQPALALAQKRYRETTAREDSVSSGRPTPKAAATTSTSASPTPVRGAARVAATPAAEPRWTLDEFEQELLLVARPAEKKVVRTVISRMRRR